MVQLVKLISYKGGNIFQENVLRYGIIFLLGWKVDRDVSYSIERFT